MCSRCDDFKMKYKYKEYQVCPICGKNLYGQHIFVQSFKATQTAGVKQNCSFSQTKSF